jgi:ribosomal protein S6
MSPSDIAAYIGAAAWLPQIGIFVWNRFAKPKISIRPDKYVSIGFTSYGPIFNLRLALYTERKKALATNIKITITHEKGNTQSFECTGLQEMYSEIVNQDGGKQFVGRDISPLMIALNRDVVSDAFFRFQQQGFHDEKAPILARLIKLDNALRKKNPQYDANEFLNSEECNNYLKFMRSKFYWLSGKYEIQFIIETSLPAEQVNSSFTMHLSQDDVDLLQSNLDLLKDELAWAIKPPSNREPYPIAWNWPNIRLINAFEEK